MSLNAKQARFFSTFCQLQRWAEEVHGIQLIGKELYRTKEQAEIHAANGVGIKNSVHRLSLAIDVYVFVDGKLKMDGDEYRILGERWEKLDPDARWGGRFRRRDVYHFSFIHNGVY